MKWFKHFSNASDDEFLARLEADLGLEAYARWWKMLEVIARQMDGSDKCEVEYSVDKWMGYLSEKRRKKLEIFLEYCQKFQKISTKYSGNILWITCPKLLELRDEYSRKSGHSPDKVAPDIRVKKKEEERKENKQASSAGEKNYFQTIYEAGSSVFPSLATANASFIQNWISAGCDPELDAVPAIQAAHLAGTSVKSWKYFDGQIIDAITRRKNPPKGNAHASTENPNSPYNKPNKSERAKAAILESAIELGYAT